MSDLHSDDWADVLTFLTGGATSIVISCGRAGGTCWKRGGIPVGRLVWSASFGGTLTWIVIDSSQASWPVVNVSGSVRVGSGSFVVDVSRSVPGEVVALVVVVLFVIVSEVGLSSSITMNVGSFRRKWLTLRKVSSR